MTLTLAEHISAALRAGAAADYDARWDHVCALHRDGSAEALEAAFALCSSPEAAKREFGADVLGQLGGSGPLSPYREQSAPLLTRLLQDADPGVVSSALFALGHLAREVNAEVLTGLADHASDDVRYALACMLPSSGVATTEALLIRLMSDRSADVRDWATFGLGSQTDLDSPAIRDAFLARVSDPHVDTRDEAIAALARRSDPRVLPALLQELRDESVGRLAVEAARDLAAPELLPALDALSSWWDVDPALLAEAIEACRSARVEPR
jgi:HEAT repeat protein